MERINGVGGVAIPPDVIYIFLKRENAFKMETEELKVGDVPASDLTLAQLSLPPLFPFAPVARASDPDSNPDPASVEREGPVEVSSGKTSGMSDCSE